MIELDADLITVLNGLQTAFLILGFLFVVVLFLVIWQGNLAKNWPTTKGIVLISEVNRLNRSPKYFARILYEYTIRRKTFKRRMIKLGDFLISHSEAYCQKKSDQYPEGEEVTVYYSPDIPGLSVLEPGVDKKVVNNFISRLVLVGICYVLVRPDVLRVILNFMRAE